MRTLVVEGRLSPLRAGAKPLRFREADVWALERRRRPQGLAAVLSAAADRFNGGS